MHFQIDTQLYVFWCKLYVNSNFSLGSVIICFPFMKAVIEGEKTLPSYIPVSNTQFSGILFKSILALGVQTSQWGAYLRFGWALKGLNVSKVGEEILSSHSLTRRVWGLCQF